MTTKILPFGVMVIDGDTHVSKWVEQSQSLRIAEKMLTPFRKYIPVGGVVVDAGAMIGDHTVTYADWVAERGVVYAFEPNQEAYECLVHNTKALHQVCTFNVALGDWSCRASLRRNVNAGASYLDSDLAGEVQVEPIDSRELDRLDFMKIDVEGFETRVLNGARGAIESLRPVMLIEVNAGALDRAGSSREELIDVLTRDFNYSVEITDSRLDWASPQYDVICLPRSRNVPK